MRRSSLSVLGLTLTTVALAGCPAPDDDDSAPPTPASYCDQQGMSERPFDADGETGTTRWSLAGDFTVELTDRTEWRLSERWTGCDSYVFVPDVFKLSPLDSTPLWEHDGAAGIIERSPRNAHYFFYSTLPNNDLATPVLEAMAERIEGDLAELDDEDAAWWREHLHVARGRVGSMDNYWAAAHATGWPGFAIDRFQRIREIGALSDVERYSSALNAADQWPWEKNLAYVANEARHYEYEARRQDRLDAESGVTIVSPFTDEVLGLRARTWVRFPEAERMEGFDTLEIDLTMWCPDQVAQEAGNCGAWDYLSHIYMRDQDEKSAWFEVARFVTTYHRAGRYVVDATPLLAQMKAGGLFEIRYEISPPWNPQAYLTQMHFRLSDRGKGYAPSAATTYLWSGRGFNAAYNDDRPAKQVPIPSTARRVELWAIISGHGGATNNCAEFCNHQHEWTVDGQTFWHEHDTIGNNTACVDAIDDGVVPNQSGTWWFGRGGWCPGQQVEPIVFDVTDSVTAGATAEISYRGLFNGGAIPNDSGNIVMSSWLVVYE